MFSILKIFESMARFLARAIASGSSGPLQEPPPFRREPDVLENRWADERRVAARGEDRNLSRHHRC
jgi:hypothetical protein